MLNHLEATVTMNPSTKTLVLCLSLLSVQAAAGRAAEARISVRADQVLHRLSPYLTGACIEDVNHEIYGGLYSQMIFGESFQEPAVSDPPRGFRAHGGTWRVDPSGELWVGGGDGPKLVSQHPGFAEGEAGVEVLLAERTGGNAGLIVKVADPGVGADNFDGYEVSLDAQGQILRFGRHRHNWEHILDTPCAVPAGQWIPLVVKMTGRSVEVLVGGRSVARCEDRDHPLRSGTVGLRSWQREARFRNLWVKSEGAIQKLPFERSDDAGLELSGMWRPVRRGTARGRCTLETRRPWVGGQSQRVGMVGGEGQFGIENQGLNRWGMSFVERKPYEGCLWARAEKPLELLVALESRDGTKVYAETPLGVTSSDWQRLDFALTPDCTDKAGRFAIKLKRPGSAAIGYAFLQPGPWGRFKGLPVRRDVAEALLDQGITVLRCGGSMVNHPEYRWKKMIGPRDRRPPCRGTWYPYSSNGWGIVDFIEFCEAAGFLCIPAFNMGETPQDMADFIDYVNGPADGPWGRRRAAAGRPQPYHLRYLELGNEERVDEACFAKFKALAEAIWAKDPALILVVGDFVYGDPIADPLRITGAASGITGLSAHGKILKLAEAHGREVWFDVHVGTDGPGRSPELAALPSYVWALEKIAGRAKHKVVVFEFNAGNHQHRRALANALAIQAIERLGPRVPIAASANCLQPDGQNDNGWNQGLLFLNPSQVWLQPPGYVTRMISRNHQPLLVASEVEGAGDSLDVSAKRSEDGKTLVLQVVNLGDRPAAARIRLAGFTPSRPTAAAEELSAPLDAVNTAERPDRVMPRQTRWRHQLADGLADRATPYTFPPRSLTVLRFE